ncbi:phosphoglucosamine mutase [Coprococcus sp. CAG:782]|jgi:phosphoglucosamine mutase|uniref:phosphoglucosamine mutase n=1 Tax=Coprococcus sp. OM04-5BH TaxID=2293093 RepID=UPI00033AAF51|nr:phosphoglucosamine mutase [Coprococcus sp. OM04-5BH]MEE0036554.1 phosphoglucosamine mutase [Coprococcus sp.]RHV31434.1 phosphoglucosamine mutase [Coprococcus sp. OM04-5BH]CCY53637.1 phosphoglucosamine mutase [Coprococcus sp. CAG:782]
MGKYFGTDGFRGEANKDLTVEHAFKVGRYLGYYYGKKNPEGRAKVVIGKDTRRSSYMFEYALVAGLTASGADAYLMHVTPTPSVSYIVRSDNFDCGIMISASHNPYYDNGIKVINGMGYKLEAAVEEEIEAYIDGEIGEIPLATRDNIGKTVDYTMGRNRYIGYLMTIPTRPFKNMRVGLDTANGASYLIAKSVFDALGAKTYIINNDPDGFNINTECGSTHIEKLQAFVKENNLDVGFAYDGDADRCLCVDDKGEIVDGDKILYVCGRYLKDKGELNNNTVVTTVMSNLGLYKAFDKKGINYEKTAVGDKYVFENMMENGHSIGGEQSGHIIFSKYATTGDGVLTSLMIMEVILGRKVKLSELFNSLTIFPQLLVNIKVTSKDDVMNDPDILKLNDEIAEELGDDGRLLLRKSGTEPVIRVMVEAGTDELCKKYVDRMVDFIKEKGYAI